MKIYNKIYITKEAKFDYKDVFNISLIGSLYKSEFETYLDLRFESNPNYEFYKRYIKVKIYDNKINRMMVCYLKRGIILANTRGWNLAGICEDSGYLEELEDHGSIIEWLESKLLN